MRIDRQSWIWLLLALCGVAGTTLGGCSSQPEEGTVLTISEKDQAALDESEKYMLEQKKGKR